LYTVAAGKFSDQPVQVLKQCQLGNSSVRIWKNLLVCAGIFHHILLTAFHFLGEKERIGNNKQQRTDFLVSLMMQDGTQIANIDAVIYCTGYQYAYPFLEGTGLVTSHDMRVDPLWQHIFPPNVAPTLSFVGLIWKSLRNPQFELQVSHSAKCKLGKNCMRSGLYIPDPKGNICSMAYDVKLHDTAVLTMVGKLTYQNRCVPLCRVS